MFSWLFKKLSDYDSSFDAPGVDSNFFENCRLSSSLSKNIKALKSIYGESDDFIIRIFNTDSGKEAALVFFDGMTDLNIAARDVIAPLAKCNKPLKTPDDVCMNIYAGGVSPQLFMNDVIKKVGNGDVGILVDGVSGAVTVDSKKFEKRSVEEPSAESVIRGPREGFIENMRTNTALIRRKIKDPHLITEEIKVGRKTRTTVALVYLDNVVNKKLVADLRSQIERIDTDSILEAGYIEQYISTNHSPLFPTVAHTEKPDVAAGKILEGRVAVIVDGSPDILTAPCFFTENFQTAEDYYIAPIYATMLRLVRMLAFFTSIIAMPFYVALTSFHQEMIPTVLLIKIASAERGTPFPVAAEAFISIMIFEILKEAGIRLPRPAGQAVSMVGAIIIGDTAVSAGIISSPLVIIIALTAVSAFAVPQYSNASTLLRLVFLLLSAFLGGFGLALGLITLFVHLSSLDSFGFPFLSPFSPFRKSDIKDSLIRAPLSSFLTRPKGMSDRNPRRQKNQ